MSIRLLGPTDRVLADRNIRVVLASTRNGSGQALADGLEAKGWQLVRQPVHSVSAGVDLFTFVVRSREEHGYQQTRNTMAFEYMSATGRGIIGDGNGVSLADLGEDLTVLDILLQPARDAAAAVAATNQRITDIAGGVVDGVRDTATNLEGAGAGIGEGVRTLSTALVVIAIGVPVLAAVSALGWLVYTARRK